VIFQLVYLSKAARHIDSAELDDILGTARVNNGPKEITGMLLYHEGSFIQVLEGEQSSVEDLFNKIAEDPRHESANVVLRTEVEERAFDQWSMGYKRTESMQDVPEGFHHFLSAGYRRKTEVDDTAARKALLAFREGRWRV